jgi:hypothetical protein
MRAMRRSEKIAERLYDLTLRDERGVRFFVGKKKVGRFIFVGARHAVPAGIAVEKTSTESRLFSLVPFRARHAVPLRIRSAPQYCIQKIKGER